jgi:hypothetical protein
VRVRQLQECTYGARTRASNFKNDPQIQEQLRLKIREKYTTRMQLQTQQVPTEIL